MPDEIYVRMITTKIQSLFPDRLKQSEEEEPADVVDMEEEGLSPEGWIVIGFPDNLQQYALFERFISGWVAPNQRPTADSESKKAEASLLAPKPYEPPPPFELFPGGVDLHFRLDVGNDEIIRRAVGRRLDPQTALVYHLEDSPPPSKKQLIYERLVPIDDLAFSQGSLTDRLHAFDVCQLEIEPLLGHFGPYEDLPRLVEVPEGPPEQIYDMVEEKVAELFDRKRVDQIRKQEEAIEAKRKMEEEIAAKEAAATEAAAPDGDAEEGTEGRASPEAGRTSQPGGGTDGAGSIAGEHQEGGETPFVKIDMLELAGKVFELEDNIREILLNQWEELQSDFKNNVQQLFRWHRAHLDDFRLGLHGIQQRFLRWVQRPDGKQSKVDKFVQDINAFSEEYPDMRKQEATKEELHCQADDLHAVLKGMVKERKTEGETESKGMIESGWVEAHIQVVAVQAQRAVQLEASKYRAACQLLRDFYSAAMGEGLLEVKAAPAKIEALPAPGAMTLAQSWKEAEGEGEERVEAHWDFPFLEELMMAAKSENIIFKLEEPPLDPDEAAAAAAAADPKAKAGKQSPQPGAVPPTAGGKASPLWVDLQQALIAEKCTYLHRLCVIKTWTHQRLLSLSDQAQGVFQMLEDWVRLREKKELDAIAELINIIKDHIESEEMIEYQLTIEGSHLHRHPNILLHEPPAPFVPPPVECDISYRWSVHQLNELSECMANAALSFGDSSAALPCSAVYALVQHLVQISAAKELQEQLHVPEAWLTVDHETLYKLCHKFDHPGQLGQVDCAEFLLHLGFLHSPLGWPSLDDLQRMRGFLESKMPAGAVWPDFYIEEADFEKMPLTP